MIKILHSADWHLDSPLQLQDSKQSQLLRKALARIPEQVATICREQKCDMLLLSGDLFDGTCSLETAQTLRQTLERLEIPVFIAPGNHDYIGPDSPWLSIAWPKNVHIFTRPVMESVMIPELDCCVYGAGFTSMDCPGLLENFTPNQNAHYAVGVLHGDPTQINSPCCPITTEQVRHSELDYLALGHIHKGDSFRAGKTLCAWPGCPMGRGYDETGEKGVLIVTIDETAQTQFIPLNTPRFHDVDIIAGTDLSTVLPPMGNEDFYRITFTGASEPLDLPAIKQEYSRFPNLLLRDRTTPPVDVWGSVGEDSLEGMYFKLLQDALKDADADTQRHICLAAKFSRQILDEQEVVLP